MNNEHFRKLINLFESRRLDVDYEESTKEVVAKLQSYNSQSFTKLAQKVIRIETLEEEIKSLKEEVKSEAKETVAELFDADDAIKTRVVETISFILTLSKDPKPTETPKYKDILEELSNHLTPELILVLEELKKKMITVTQKSPTLKAKERASGNLTEGAFSSVLGKFRDLIANWGQNYDQKLDALKSKFQAEDPTSSSRNLR